MFEMVHTYLKVRPVSRVLMIGLLLILAFAVTTGFVWVATDQVVAPPGLRILDWFWRAFQF